MARLYVIGYIVAVLGFSLSKESTQMYHSTRDTGDQTDDVVEDTDTVTFRVSSILETIQTLQSLSSQEDIQAEVGNIDNFVTSNLRDMSDILTDISDKGNVSDTTRSEMANWIQSIEDLSYFLTLGMDAEESRRLTVNQITLYISKFPTSNFRGHHFSQNDAKCSISVPRSVSFPGSEATIIVTSYSVSGIQDIMPQMGNDSLASDVISTTFLDVNGHVLTLTLQDAITVEMEVDQSSMGDKEPLCTFLEDTGTWSSSGCETVYPVKDRPGTVQCLVDHLSSFGVILTDKIEDQRLGPIAKVGCSVTILFCLLTALVFIGYRLMATVRCYIRVSFLFALAMAEMLFLCISYKEGPAMCAMIASGIHFFVTSSFAWLLSYALFLGNDLSGEVDASLSVAHYTFIGWAIPFVVVLITFIWRYDSYVQEGYCWISQNEHGLRYAYIIPICIFIVVTLIVLLYDAWVYVSIKDPKRKYALKITRSGLRSCCALLPILAVVWIIADFLIITEMFWLQIVFSVLNVILGILIFLIMFYFNEEVSMRRNGKEKRIKLFKDDSDDDRTFLGTNLLWTKFSKSRKEREVTKTKSPPGSPVKHHRISPSEEGPSSITEHVYVPEEHQSTSVASLSPYRGRRFDVASARQQFFHDPEGTHT